jgi:probable biosynthetic protein (TIGR04098 family)
MNVEEIILKNIKEINNSDFKKSIFEVGIDSIDLVKLRVEIEQEHDKDIPDEVWLKMTCLNDLINFYSSAEQRVEEIHVEKLDSSEVELKRNLVINMPQMALEGLSESWLFKEVGDFHWEMLCTNLGVNSSSIEDEAKNRLYATFVRIRIESDRNLNQFKENESLELDGDIFRYGDSLYFSECLVFNSKNRMKINMMTTFSSRGHDNTSLVKGKPKSDFKNMVHKLDSFPKFGQQYMALRKEEIEEITLSGYSITINETVVFQTEYKLNPYTDLNGVNLLYFAAYPVISDYCEQLFTTENEEFSTKDHWAKSVYTKAKDVYYFSNCNINDVIIYKIHLIEKRDDNYVIHSSLTRKSDSRLMARIFAIKNIL